VHKDQVKGAAKEAKGSMKEGLGKAMGDRRMEAEGLADRAAGKMQKGAGKLKDDARRALKN